MNRPDRLTRLRAAMVEAELPAVLISQPEARRYLSGYGATDLPPRESAGYLLITEDRQLLLTDPRTEGQAIQEAPAWELRIYKGDQRAWDLVKEVAGELHLTRIGFEAQHLPYAFWEAFREALEGVAELVPAPPLTDKLRMVKDPDELEKLRASIALNDAAFAYLARQATEGPTERELAWEMERFVRTHGAEGVSFNPITVGGPNTAIPHAVPSDRQVRPDELILLDIGAKLDGYCSDMTRTFCIESTPAKLRDVWQVVRDGQQAAIDAVRPGMTGKDVDAVARQYLADAGYGDQFTHGTGHGVGLEIHEPPWITSGRGVDVLEPGMVFSIEPGVYLPEVGGVRIEDLVLLTEHGAEVLSRAPKKLHLTEVLRDLDR